jgi:hypothetical protein
LESPVAHHRVGMRQQVAVGRVSRC